MVTCVVKYRLDPRKLDEFQHYANMWIALVSELGGTHHGYFMPHEGANDLALALFSFESLAAYEKYREASRSHEGCLAALEYYERTQCFLSYERTFMRPILGDGH